MRDEAQQRHASMIVLHRGSNACVVILVPRFKTRLMKERHQLKVSQSPSTSCYVLIEDRCAISLCERSQIVAYLVAEIIHVKQILAEDSITLCSGIISSSQCL